ncbi:TonB-dependent receptor [Alteromonas sp. BL110]|uniref:TonB-dependent receptor n=1 Tax=Alteromonas sp. BL110 TaxID=1714845 RepID=UPI000E537F46|nr:TonB-dependent receptor [Alteromonas sp. BL110]AXT39077.1 TonB-dependent receptor [Alteromonas sp. BL110]RKM85267.1 TonB-dependent receptor [Alteromonas sp. BL110]
MFKNKRLSLAVKQSLLITSVMGVTTSLSAYAQTTEENTEAPIEKIQVTGSHIKRVDLESVSPVTVITAESIKLSGDTTVADVLRNSSINTFGSFRGQSGYGGGAAASSEVNLRGLGAGATLVLMDGRRLPGLGYDGGSSSDMSMIPMSIVERIEILRDGASAIYGSDAVAGVINIITKKEFDGVEFGYNFEDPGVDGGNSSQYNFAAGLTSDKGSIVFIAEHANTQEVADVAVNGDFADGSYSLYSPVANFLGDSADSYTYNTELCGDVTDTSIESDRCGYYYGNSTWLYGASEKNSILTKVAYELTDSITFNSRFSAQQTSTDTRYAATPVSTSSVTIDSDNAMNPYGEDGNIYFRTASLGTRDTTTEKTTFELVTGLEGYSSFAGNDWDWQINYQRTNAKEEVFNYNLVNDTVVQDLIDTEQLDLFNVQGLSTEDWSSYNAELLDLARHTGTYQSTQKRDIIDASISGEVFANDFMRVSAVVGAEYSHLDFEQISDPESGLGFISGGSGGDDVYATRKRQSYFTEVAVELPHDVEISGALRYDGYELEGDTGAEISTADFSDTVPKLGISWRPSDSLLLRASWGEAFRTPTMSEMFASISYSFPSAYDTYYCDTQGNAASDTSYCSTTQQHLTYYGGNPNLKPENSESLTLGLVYDVTDDFSVELSYYQYDYENKIEDIDVDDLIAADLDGTSSNIVRGSNGQILSITSGYTNYAEVKTSGLDLTADYRVPTSIGEFGVNLELSHVISYEEQGIEWSGELFYPDNRGNVTLDWNDGDQWTASWRTLFIGSHGDTYYDSYQYADNYFKHNVTVSYQVNEHLLMSAGINNVTDELIEYDPGVWRGYDDALYDPLGRTVNLRLQASF